MTTMAIPLFNNTLQLKANFSVIDIYPYGGIFEVWKEPDYETRSNKGPNRDK